MARKMGRRGQRKVEERFAANDQLKHRGWGEEMHRVSANLYPMKKKSVSSHFSPLF